MKMWSKLAESKYIDDLLKKVFGSEIVDSFDFTDYEGCTILHDFNYPISEMFANKYDVVFDGGPLEHIFNFPTAVANSLYMVKEGGYFISISPTNNFCGHGFYQFSPELWYRVLNKNNGFEIKKMILYVDRPETPFYLVRDPEECYLRVGLVNAYPTYLFVLAQKMKHNKLFEVMPQQSDYVRLWHLEYEGPQSRVPIDDKEGVGKWLVYIKVMLFNLAKWVGIKKDYLGKVYFAQAFSRIEL